MRAKLIGTALLSALALVGCASTEFQAYEGRTNVYQGQGGTKAVVDGMEIWEGEPPRKYAVVGVLKDERGAGILPMSMLRGDMVKQAKERGGDALINMGGTSTFVGTISTGSANATTFGNQTRVNATGTSIAARRASSNFAVIRYLD